MERLRYDDDTAFTLADDAATVARIVRTTTAERMRVIRFDAWSALELLGHVADTAEVFAERVRRCIAEEKPKLASFDPDAVAAQRRNDAGDPMAMAKRIQAAHAQIVRLLVQTDDRARLGVHAEWGEVDVAHIAAYHARHAHEHVSDIAAHFPPSS